MENPEPKGGMVRRLLLLAALSVVFTLAFASVAMAQSPYAPPNSTVDCSAAEEGQPPGIEFFFLPDAGGCIAEGSEGGGLGGMLVNDLNKVVFDPDTGERLGIAKELDPDLSSGANSVTYQEFCADFNNVPADFTTPQEYFEGTANAEEQAILDPNGDGLACTAKDEAFLAGNTGQIPSGDVTQPQQPNGFADFVYNQTLIFGFTGGVPLPESSLENLPDSTQQFVEGYTNCGDEATDTARDASDVVQPSLVDNLLSAISAPFSAVFSAVSSVVGVFSFGEEFNETLDNCGESLEP